MLLMFNAPPDEIYRLIEPEFSHVTETYIPQERFEPAVFPYNTVKVHESADVEFVCRVMATVLVVAVLPI